MAQIMVFLAQGFEEIEALTVVDLLRRAKLDVATVSITEDPVVVSSHKIPVTADICIKDADFDTCDMIVLPGGIPGTPNLENCEKLMTELDRFYADGRCIGAICAAPSIFAHRGYLKGQKASCNPCVNEDIVAGLAQVSEAPVTVTGKIITSRAMGTAIEFGLAIVEHFKGREFRDQLSAAIIH